MLSPFQLTTLLEGEHECHFDRSHGRHNRRLISPSIKVVIDVSSCTKSLNELHFTPIGIRDIGACNSPNVAGQGEWTIAYTTVWFLQEGSRKSSNIRSTVVSERSNEITHYCWSFVFRYIGVVDLSSKSDRESNASWRNVAVSPDRTVSTSVDGMMAIFMAKWC
jgi:hypothetical protein